MYETETHFKDPSYEGSPLTNIRDNFASQADIPLKETSRDLQRIGAVVDGLKRVYDNVAQRAAEGMALTPQEASDVNMAVTGMAETASVDCQTLSTENFLDPYGAIVSTGITMEGIKESILSGLKRSAEIIIKFFKFLLSWVGDKSRHTLDLLRKTRHTWRDFVTTVNESSLKSYTFKEEVPTVLLVDGNVPTNIADAMTVYFTSCEQAIQNTADAVVRIDSMLDGVYGSVKKVGTSSSLGSTSTAVATTPDTTDAEIEIGVNIGKFVKFTNYRALQNTKPVKQASGGTVRISRPLIGNNVLVYVKPESNSPEDIINDGSVVMDIAAAEERFEIKTGYETELKGKRNVVFAFNALAAPNVGRALDSSLKNIGNAASYIKSVQDLMPEKINELISVVKDAPNNDLMSAAMRYVRLSSIMLRAQQSNLQTTYKTLESNMHQMINILIELKSKASEPTHA